MLNINPHNIYTEIFSGDTINEETVDISKSHIFVEIHYFEDYGAKFGEVMVYFNTKHIANCRLCLAEDQDEILVVCVEQNGTDYLIIRDEFQKNIISINMDLKKLLMPRTFNEKYKTDNILDKKWVSIFEISENILIIETEGRGENRLYTVCFDYECEGPYFYVIPSNQIKVFGDVNIFKENEIIKVIDSPGFTDIKRERLFCKKGDFVVSVINRSDCSNDNLDFLLIDIESPNWQIDSPCKNYKLEIFKNEKIIIKLSKKDQDIAYIIYDIKESKEILSFSEPVDGKTSYLVLKRNVGDNPIVVDLENNIVNEFKIEDKVFLYSTVHKEISISNDGKYLYIMGKIKNKIPYFNIYKLNTSTGLNERMKNKFATIFNIDASLSWAEDKITITENDKNYNFHFKDNCMISE